MTKRGVDVSAYQCNLPWANLKANGVDFAIVKGDQETATDNHVYLARQAGLDVQLYFWHDPTFSPSTQISWFIDDIKQWQPSAIWLDCEQYWANWTQYWQMLKGVITAGQLLRISPQIISDNALAVLRGLASVTNIPIGIYTGQWFVCNYALPMAKWIDNYPLWLASYFDMNGGKYPATWATINSAPPATFNPIQQKQSWIPKTYQILQYSSRMIAPGMTDAIDWDITGLQPPATFTPYKVVINATATPYVNIRPQPNTSQAAVGHVYPGVIVVILEESLQADGIWGRIASPYMGWIRLDFTQKVTA